MANTPKKAKDPTTAAMSAIQEALSVRGAEMKPSTRPAPAPSKKAKTETAPEQRVSDTLANAAPDDIWRDEPAPSAEIARRPANDDRKTIGEALQALKPGFNRMVYVSAGVASLVAIAGVFLFGSQSLAGTGAAGVVAAIFLPTLFFFSVAHMYARSRELRVIAQSMAEVAMSLGEPDATAREAIVSVGQAVRREVAAMGDGVERALARASELEALVQNEVTAIERTYHENEVRLRSLIEDMIRQRDALTAQAEQVRTALTGVHVDLNRDLSSVGELFAGKVNVAADTITNSLTQKGEQITQAFSTRADAMMQSLSIKGGELLERLEHASATHAEALSRAGDTLSSKLQFKTDHVTGSFEKLVDDLAGSMQSRLAAITSEFEQKSNAIGMSMSDRTIDLTRSLNQTAAEAAETISSRGEEVANTLRSTGDSLAVDLGLRGQDVVAKLTDRTTHVVESFERSADKIASTIGERGEALRELLQTRLQGFEEMFTRDGTQLAEKVGRDSEALGNLITRHIGEFDRTVKDYGGELVNRLGERTTTITESMRSYIDNFDQRVTAKTVDATSAIDERIAKFQETIDGRTQSINDALGSRVVEIATTLAMSGKEVVGALEKRIAEVNDAIASGSASLTETVGARMADVDKTLHVRTDALAQTLDARINQFEQLLVKRAEAVTEQIEARTKSAAEILHSRVEQLADTIKTNTETAERTLSQLAGTTTEAARRSAKEIEDILGNSAKNISDTFRARAADAERSLVGTSAEVARNFIGKAAEIQTAVSQRATEMTNILDANSAGFLTALNTKSRDFTDEISRATEHAVRAIESKGFDFTKSMFDNSEELARQINEASAQAVDHVNTSIRHLKEKSDAAILQQRESSAAAVAEMLDTNSKLATNGLSMFERLREANIVLHDLINQANENMHGLENTLNTRVVEFAQAWTDVSERGTFTVEQINEHVLTFRDITAGALNELANLAGTFELHGRVLSEAVEAVDVSNRRTDEAVEMKRITLDALVNTLDAKTEDMQQRLTRFSSLLDESLDSASKRAREVARVVADASNDGARAVAQQFAIVRETAEKERKHTYDTLEKIYEKALGDTRSMFTQTSERFAELVQSVKGMTAEIERELDATRAELRRGVMELPDETAESAANMRRVIIDQIDALNELNRLVTRYGRTGSDDFEPQTRRIPVPSREPALSVVGGRQSPRMPGRNDMPPPPPPVHQASEAPSLAPGGSRSGGGWLSDVLNRASRDDAEPAREERPRKGQRQPRHMIESLDALSVDIARMIDHDAAAELWDRYNRGERNVFTRKLYTLQGQKAFDEIRSRYRADPEFKQTVDHYMIEFERLLEEAARDERGQMVVRTYLTSETGKVYTMLAHASGRFD